MKYIAALLLSGCSTIPQQIDSARYTAQLSGRTHCYLTGGVIAWSSRGEIERLREALEGVIRIAGRDCPEFRAARAALAKKGGEHG